MCEEYLFDQHNRKDMHPIQSMCRAQINTDSYVYIKININTIMKPSSLSPSSSSSSSLIYDYLIRDTTMAAESLSAMLEKEQTIYHHCKSKCDYLLHHHRRSNNNNNEEATETAVTENARIKIIDWFYSVIDKCQFDRSPVAMAIDIMDRYLSTVSSNSNSNSDSSSQHEHDASLLPRHSSLKQFQLVAITSLYIAIKTNEVIVISSSFFAAMSRYDYSSADIEAMELLILQTLKWHIHAPTVFQIAYTVLSSLILLSPHDDNNDDIDVSSSSLHDDIINNINNNNHESSMLWENIVDEVQYQSELAVRDYKLCIQYRPSTLALAIIINTICSNQQNHKNHKNQSSCNNNIVIMEKRRDQKVAILRALLLVMKDHHHHNRGGEEHSFDTFDKIMRARRRLRHIVEAVYTSSSNISSSNSHDDDDDDVRETVSIVSGGGETMLETSMRCSVVLDHLSSCPECCDDMMTIL